MDSSSRAGSSKRLVIEVAKSYMIKYPQPNKQLRVQVCTINGLPYVGFTKFWHLESENKWLPSKSNVFLPPSVWKAVEERSHEISAAVKTIEEEQTFLQTNELPINCIITANTSLMKEEITK